LAIVVGAIRFARAQLERKREDRFAYVLAGVGAILLIVALYLYSSGPHRVLPF